MKVSSVSSQSLYCCPIQVERMGSRWAFLDVSCGRSFQVSILSIRSSSLGELDPAASGVEVMVFPSLLRKDETEPKQTSGRGQDPLRSQLCHQLTSCGFGRASCHAHSGVQQLLLGVLLAWLTACGVFAWEIFGYPCGDGWLLKSSQQI